MIVMSLPFSWLDIWLWKETNFHNWCESKSASRRTASATYDFGAWIAVSDDGVLHKALASHLSDLQEKFPASLASWTIWKALDRQGDSDAALLLIQTNQAISSNVRTLRTLTISVQNTCFDLWRCAGIDNSVILFSIIYKWPLDIPFQLEAGKED